MTRSFAAFICTLAMAAAATAQPWKVYTSSRDVNQIVADSTEVFAATTGGLFWFTTGSWRVFTSEHGLGSHNLNAVATDSEHVWLGGPAAILTRFNPRTWVARLYPLSLGVSTINALLVTGDTVWVGTDIGVGLFLPEMAGGVFKEVYTQLGALPSGAAVSDLMFFDARVWAVTSSGVASALRSDPNLHLPGQWSTYAQPAGVARTIRALEVWRDSLYAASDSGLYVLKDSVFQSRSPRRLMFDLVADFDTLWVGTDSGLYFTTGDSLIHVQSRNLVATPIHHVAKRSGAETWIGGDGYGLFQYGFDTISFYPIAPNEPPGPVFAGVAVSPGIVWCAQRGSGASYLDDGVWRAITGIPASPGGPLYSVFSVGPTAYYPAWGAGLAIVTPAGGSVSITRFDASNSALASVVTDPVYTVVIDAEVTSAGGVWAANRYTNNGQALVYFAPGYSPQVVYDNPDGFTSSDMLVTLLTGNILWVGYNGLGLYALDTRGTPEIKGDDELTIYRVEGTGLPSDVISALLEDKDGKIWVGTPGGLARFSPEFFPFITPLEYADIRPAGSSVLALASDLRNNIWVGTERGLARIPTGSLTADSVWFTGATPLPDNRVNGLAEDIDSNAIWIATDNGLARFALGTGSPSTQPAEPVVYPNPFFIRGDADSVTIAVPFGARVDIYTIAGDRVRTLKAGNRWDGRNESGQFVSSGLYVFRVTYIDGSTGRGRIGVIRTR
jgi:hypothetical protein